VAGSWKNLQSGDQAAQEFLNKLDQKKTDAGSHPFYKGISQEANLKDADLEGTAKSLARKDPVGQMVREGYNSRPKMNIDPQKDPLMLRSQKVMDNPLEAIGGSGTHVTEIAQGGKDETLICEEPGDDYLESCQQNLKVTVIKTKVRKEWRGQFQYSKCSNSERKSHYLPCIALRQAVSQAWTALRGKSRWRHQQAPINIDAALNITGPYKACMHELATHKGRSCSYCTASTSSLPFKEEQIKEVSLVKHPQNPKTLHMASSYVHVYNSGRSEYSCQPLIKIIYEEDSYQILPDEWVLSCDQLEEKVDQGLCSYGPKTCTQGPQTRVIEGVPITRDCWQETRTYTCSYPSKDDCGPLRARGCAQINSACKQKIGNVCAVYTQTYECKGQKHTRHEITGGATSTLKVPFCLDGNCREQSWELNDEMMSSVAQLALLKEMQGQFESGSFFKGTDHQCSKYILHFKDCCGSDKGWGKSVGLAGNCKPKEKALSLKRKARLCHYVGTYCAKKELGQCIKKKSSYCCFGSKLLKAFHEQGRSQIGLGWGSAEQPLCRGFTIDEIQRIDFSKLDLSEVFEDLIKDYQPGKLQGTGKTIGDRLDTIKRGIIPPGIIPKGILPKTEKQPKQREEA